MQYYIIPHILAPHNNTIVPFDQSYSAVHHWDIDKDGVEKRGTARLFDALHPDSSLCIANVDLRCFSELPYPCVRVDTRALRDV